MIIFFLCLIISGALIGGSFYFKENMQKEHQRNQAMFQSVSNKYFAVDEEEKLIKKYYPLFIDLYNNGVIGRELRLNWIETLRKAGDEIRIPGLSYEIRSQEIYKPEFKVKMGKYKLYSSVMNLNMQLLHEGDLFHLLEALDRDALGAYSVNNCNMAMKGEVISDDAEGSNISVRCELLWHTIKLANGKELEV